MRVLVASEDRAERDLIRGALSAHDAVRQVSCFEDGVDAYIAARESVPDILVISADLPRMDGIVLARTVASSPQLRTARTLLVLGVSCLHRVRDALEARPTALIVRPFDGRVFMARFSDAMSAPPDLRWQADSGRSFGSSSDLHLTADLESVRLRQHGGIGPEAKLVGRADRRRSPWQALKARIAAAARGQRA